MQNLCLPALLLSGVLGATALAAETAAPRLPAGPHMGWITGFDQLDRKQANAVAQRYAEARAAGMTLSRVQIDWAELEPTPGAYDIDALQEALDRAASEGDHIFFTLSTLDSEGLTLPEDLMTPEAHERPDIPLDSPDMLARLDGLMAWLVPELTKAGVWGLSIANEPDSPINEGYVDGAAAETFLIHAIDAAQRLDPDLAVMLTWTGGGYRHLPESFERITETSDMVAFNTYCLEQMLTVNGPADWEAQLNGWLEAVGDKEIFIQELGCPVGYGPNGAPNPEGIPATIGGSVDIQAEYLRWHLDAFATTPQLRGATVFQLLDWSPELSTFFTEVFYDGQNDWIGDRVHEWLGSSGICRWEDVSCGPAFDVWVSGMADLKAVRDRK